MHRLTLTVLALAPLAFGCGPAPSTAAPGVTSSTGRSLDTQPGVGAVLPSVGRTVGLHELQEIAQFYQVHREDGMQAHDLVVEDLRKGDPKLYQALKENVVVILAGDPGRPSLEASNTIVAYTPADAPAKGGLAAFLDGHADKVPPFQNSPNYAQLGQ